jgi:hypothetical protein
MKRVLGGLIFALGVILSVWVIYNLFVNRLPETQGKSPIPAIFVAAGFIYVGVKWMKGETAG